MNIYISGKMTGLPDHRVRKKFKIAEEYLRNEGFTPVNPAVMLDNPGLEYRDYMYIAIAMLDVCEAIYMLSDWEDSKGAKIEHKCAIEDGKKIIYEDPATERKREENIHE